MNPEWYVINPLRNLPQPSPVHPEQPGMQTSNYEQSHTRSITTRISTAIYPATLNVTLTSSSDTTTSSSFCLSVTLVLESLACCCDSPMTHTPSPTSLPLVSTSYVLSTVGITLVAETDAMTRKSEQSNSMERQSNYRSCVCLNNIPPNWILMLNSGTLPAKSVSEPSHPPTTEAHTESAWSTM
jgi:hypothetical protein